MNELRRFLIAFAVIRKLRVISGVESASGEVLRIFGSPLPVRVLVLLHKLAMHDNTEGIGRISTHRGFLGD
jgi:hypothetical protein